MKMCCNSACHSSVSVFVGSGMFGERCHLSRPVTIVNRMPLLLTEKRRPLPHSLSDFSVSGYGWKHMRPAATTPRPLPDLSAEDLAAWMESEGFKGGHAPRVLRQM